MPRKSTTKQEKFVMKSRDGREMKVYVENGCTEGLAPRQLIEKYPQFKRYDSKQIADAFRRTKSALLKTVSERSKLKEKFELRFFAEVI